MKRKILFLCTGNSCRSQMAEAIVNARMGDNWEAVSAGTKPTGYVHPKALAALAEIGIQHKGRSKLADEFRGMDFDLVVTVCDSAAEECPIWLPVPRPEGAGGKVKRIHHSFLDPAKAEGTDEQIMEAFRRVRDEILRVIPALIEVQ
jgi:arsenate reductase (thioredoxin)